MPVIVNVGILLPRMVSPINEVFHAISRTVTDELRLTATLFVPAFFMIASLPSAQVCQVGVTASLDQLALPIQSLVPEIAMVETPSPI